MINHGDKVEKIGGDYTFVGIVVAKFRKARKTLTDELVLQEDEGAIRFVVQDDRGILHIYSEKNLRKL